MLKDMINKLSLLLVLFAMSGIAGAETVYETFDTDPQQWLTQGNQSEFDWNPEGYVDVTLWRSEIKSRFFRLLGKQYTQSEEFWWGCDFKIREDVSSVYKRGYFGLFDSNSDNKTNLIGNYYWDKYETDLPRHMGAIYRSDGSSYLSGKVLLSGLKCYRYRCHYWSDANGNGWFQTVFYGILPDGSTGALLADSGAMNVITAGQSFTVDSIGLANLFSADTNTSLKQSACFDNVFFSNESELAVNSIPSFAVSGDFAADSSKRKIIVDFNGLKKTREYDAVNDGWSYFGESSGPYVADEYTRFNYSRADLLDENGNNQIASMWHPQIGMHSCYDEDFIEYQILLAKAAHIDGFSVEWGFPEHESNNLVHAMQEIALKYDFELMVTWCPNWQLQWLKYYRDFTCPIEETYVESYERLLADIYSHPTAVTWDGHPLILWFYGGGTVDYHIDQYLTQAGAKIPEGMKEPWVFGRDEFLSANGFHSTFMWAPPRPYHGGVQDVTGNYIYWDYYGVIGDIFGWMTDYVNTSSHPVFASVFPGMDNRPSAGWGGKLKYFSHNDGQTQREMWNWILQNKEDIDIVLGITWNDWAEGTQVLPTVEDGMREIATMEECGAAYKEIESDPSALALPGKLFELRKKCRKLEDTGYVFESVSGFLDQAAVAISSLDCESANEKLSQAENILNAYEKATMAEHIELAMPSDDLKAFNPYVIGGDYCLSGGWGLYLSVSENVASKLRSQYYEGYLEFEYLDSSNNEWGTDRKYREVWVKASPARTGYETICEFYKDDTNLWKKARVRIYKKNTEFDHSLPYNTDIQLGCLSQSGEDYFTKVRNVKLSFDVYSEGFDVDDFMMMAQYWLADCSGDQNCQNYDSNEDGTIDLEDFAAFSLRWIEK